MTVGQCTGWMFGDILVTCRQCSPAYCTMHLLAQRFTVVDVVLYRAKHSVLAKTVTKKPSLAIYSVGILMVRQAICLVAI